MNARELDENRLLMLRAMAVVVSAIITVAAMTTWFVFVVEEPGARLELAMNHIMLGVVGGPVMVALLITLHFISAWHQSRKRKRGPGRRR